MMRNLFIIFLSVCALYGAPAIQNEIEFTQPDGTTFKGYLKGDSAFHWIESGNDIIVYNPKDKYYYKAIVDREKGLIPSGEKAGENVIYKSALFKEKKDNIQRKNDLQFLYRKAKDENGPR
jgi:hypothetical protein